MAGATVETVAGDVAQPRKKKPSAIVDGNMMMRPERRELTRSANRDSRAIKPPPIMNEVMSWNTKSLFTSISTTILRLTSVYAK